MNKLYATVIALCAMTQIHAQTDVKIMQGLRMPADTPGTKLLIKSLNSFLDASQKPHEQNPWVADSGKIGTYIQLDELENIQADKNGRIVYQPYLTNLVRVSDRVDRLQVFYIGKNDSLPPLRAMFTFYAIRQGDSIHFASPLLYRTSDWKQSTIGNMTFHYKYELNGTKAKNINRLASEYDKKIQMLSNGNAERKTVIYCTNSIDELQWLVGVEYKSDHAGRKRSVWTARSGNTKWMVLGNDNAHFDDFDEHDLWHDRLQLVIARNKVARCVDEGCAYLYGGSWGYSWKQIMSEFKKQPGIDTLNFLTAKTKPVYFKTGEFPNSNDYVATALLVQKIEKEHGFKAVWELMLSDPSGKEPEKYFQVLEKYTGINRNNYNKSIHDLIALQK